MRRTLSLLSLVLAFALVAAACGDEDETTTAGADPDDGSSAIADPDPDSDSDTDTGADDGSTGDADLPLGAGPYPIADLTITADATETEEEPPTYRLACLGDTATFTGEAGSLSAETACLALNDEEVRNRLLTDEHLGRICTEQYGGPQFATITGTLDDQSVDTTVDRANGCGIDDWDRVLAALLPAAS